MKKNLLFWQLGALTFSAVLGTLLHFLYDWTGLNIFKPISAVNESTWEHMKLLFFPAFIFSFIQQKASTDKNEFWLVKLIGTICGLILIPVLFYTYNGAFGKSPDILNVAIFFIALFFEYFIEFILFKYSILKPKSHGLALGVLIVIAVAFVIFTYSPPNLPLFISPV